MYKSLFIISGTCAVLGLAVAHFLFKVAPYSSAETILLRLSALGFLVLFITFLVYGASKGFIKWVLLFIGWLISIFHTILILDEAGSGHPIDALGLIYAAIFALILMLIFLGISFGMFTKQYRQHKKKWDLIGLVLSVLPVLVFIILMIIG